MEEGCKRENTSGTVHSPPQTRGQSDTFLGCLSTTVHSLDNNQEEFKFTQKSVTSSWRHRRRARVTGKRTIIYKRMRKNEKKKGIPCGL